MTLLATADWLVDGEVFSTETSPIDLERVAAVEKSLELKTDSDGCTITLRLQFDPPLWAQQAPPDEDDGERLCRAVHEVFNPADGGWDEAGELVRNYFRAALTTLLRRDVIRPGRGA